MRQDLGFYSTAAQVIPVLLLAFALDVRYTDRNYTNDVGEWLALWNFVVGVVALAVGEVFALKVLDGGRATVTDRAVVISALGVGGFFLLLEVLLSRILVSPLMEEHMLLVKNITVGVLMTLLLALFAVVWLS